MMQAGVWDDMMVQSRARVSIIMGLAVDQWYTNRVCDRAWVDVCSKYGWYHRGWVLQELVQGLGHAREKYGKLLLLSRVGGVMQHVNTK